MKFICVDCGYTFKGKKDRAWYECPKCKGSAWWEGSSKFTGAPHVKKYKEPVAFGHDKKTGQPIAIDKKGKRFDPSETRYNLNRDPKGWKAVGKKIRDKDQSGEDNI